MTEPFWVTKERGSQGLRVQEQEMKREVKKKRATSWALARFAARVGPLLPTGVKVLDRISRAVEDKYGHWLVRPGLRLDLGGSAIVDLLGSEDKEERLLTVVQPGTWPGGEGWALLISNVEPTREGIAEALLAAYDTLLKQGGQAKRQQASEERLGEIRGGRGQRARSQAALYREHDREVRSRTLVDWLKIIIKRG